jgi:hypothetical protein
MTPIAVGYGAVFLVAAFRAASIALVNRFDRRAAAANRVRTKRLPRQLATRAYEFDQYGRTGL